MKGTLLICIIHPYSVLAGPNIRGTMFRFFYIFGRPSSFWQPEEKHTKMMNSATLGSPRTHLVVWFVLVLMYLDVQFPSSCCMFCQFWKNSRGQDGGKWQRAADSRGWLRLRGSRERSVRYLRVKVDGVSSQKHGLVNHKINTHAWVVWTSFWCVDQLR